MIDPDNIHLENKNNDTIMKINEVPEYDFVTWDLDNDKELKKYLTAVEREIRHSYEYKEMIQYLRDNYGMDQCAFLKVSNKDSYDIRIEIHHYPFTLYDIVCIVYRKRIFYQESLEVEMVAKEVTMLHYKLMIGLVPLSKTVHQLVHAGKLFIPIQSVVGRWEIFIDQYKDFCDPEQLETIERIEKYSEEESTLYNTSILDTNHITIDSQNNPEYQLPSAESIDNKMHNRISEINNNNMKLPDKRDNPKERRAIVNPIYFEGD